MIRAEASIPIRVFTRDNIDVIENGPSQGLHVVRVRLVNQFNHLHHTERKEVCMGEPRIRRSQAVLLLHAVYEPPLGRIYTSAGAVVENRRLPFPVNIDLEELLHFQVTPALFEMCVKLLVKENN